VDPSLWKPEGGSYRSDDGTRRVAVFYEDSDRDSRVEVSIAIDRLPDFYDVPDHSLGTIGHEQNTSRMPRLKPF